MPDPTKRLVTKSLTRSEAGASGSPVLKEPYEHLFQHIKQTDPMLYEALKRLTGDVTDVSTNVTEVKSTILQDKCTFGLIKSLVVGSNLTTDYYICRKGGTFVDWVAKISIQAPTGSDAILDVLRSTDDGTTWNSIFLATNRIVLPAGKTKLVTVPKLAVKGINIGDLLRIDCLQKGSTNPGKGIEVVGRWTTNG